MTDQRFCLPVRPTWNSTVDQTYSYRTDILTSRAGREDNRRALRVDPRVSFEFPASGSRNAVRAAARYYTNRLDELGFAANPIEFVRLTDTLAVGAATVPVSDVPYWLTDGNFVILRQGDAYELHEIDSVAGSDVTLGALAAAEWPAGTRMFKAERMRLTGAAASMNMLTRGVATYTVRFDVDPAALLLPDVGAAGDTFDGRELLLKQPNLLESINVAWSSGQELVDYDAGLVAGYSPVPFTMRDYKATFLGRDPDEVAEIVDFFRRMRGRQGEFFAPSNTADLSPLVDLASGTATLKTAGRVDYDEYTDTDTTSGRLVNNAIFVALRDGTYVAKKISTVTLVGSDSVFTMTTNWAANIALADIKYISFLPLCRFGSDELTIEWLTTQAAQFNLAIHTLEYQAAET